MSKNIIIVGSGNAAMSAGIAALEKGASVLMLEKADEALAGGNTKYTAGAMRFAYDGIDDLMPLLQNPNDPRSDVTDFDGYTRSKFKQDLLGFNGGRKLSVEQERLIGESLSAMQWLGGHGVKFEPIYSRQSFEKNGRHVFWGGLTLAADNEGVGLFDMELAAFTKMGGEIRYNSAVTGLVTDGDTVTGVFVGDETLNADAVILACGGFEASAKLRAQLMGDNWEKAKVRGTPHNTGDGLTMAHALGAEQYGLYANCHATPMDLHMPEYANLDLPAGERKNYRKICYFLGVMLNAKGDRFVDEGENFRNYTYAQFGKSVLDQPGNFAWQVFDAKTEDLMYAEYRFHDVSCIEANTLEDLCTKMDGVNAAAAVATLNAYNDAVMNDVDFDPSVLDGKGTSGLALAKSNWAQKFDTPPYKAYPVTGGITFTYGGLKISETGGVLRPDGTAIAGLYACGEMVGGVFFEGYPGGSGLTSGAVFGRIAGQGAVQVSGA